MKLNYNKIDSLNNAFLHIPLRGISILDSAENITKLKPHLDTILTVKTKLINQHTNGKDNIQSDHKNWNKFVQEFNKNLEKEVDVGELVKVKKTDLDLDRAAQINLQGFLAVLMDHGLLE